MQERKSSRHGYFSLLTYPRTCSNLLIQILALDQQPNVVTGKHGGYYFLPAAKQRWEMGLRAKHVGEWTLEEQKQLRQAYQDCFDKFTQDVDRAEAEGKILFVKEHCCFLSDPVAESRFLLGNDNIQEAPWTVSLPEKYGKKATRSEFNETVLPDAFLMTWLPTFLIRHPALVFPSRYRTVLDLSGREAGSTEETGFALTMTMHWSRTLYEWYEKHLNKSEGGVNGEAVSWPLILDADDILTKPAVVAKFTEIIGLDPTKLRFSWSPATEEEKARVNSAIELKMRANLLASSGIIPGKSAKDLEIDVEAKKWREEFGEEEGKRMEKWVRAAMPDYEFMKARRLRPEM